MRRRTVVPARRTGSSGSLSALQPTPRAPGPFPRAPELPPLQPVHWLAPGGQRAPDARPLRVCADDLQEAALRGDLGLVRCLLQAGASANAPLRARGNEEFLTLPHALASRPEVPNSARILAELLSTKANPDARSSFGSTALMFACLHKHMGAAEVLLGCGARASPTDDLGRSALHCAVVLDPARPASERLSVELLRLLLAAHADLNGDGGRPPITEAVLQGNGPCVGLLLELGAEPDGLHEAVTGAPLAVIRQLVEASANPFRKDREGKSVMEAALARGDEAITTLLRDYVGDLERSQHPHLASRGALWDDARPAREAARPRAHCGHRCSEVSRRSLLARPLAEESADGWRARRAWLQQRSRRTLDSTAFQALMLAALLSALFLPDLWVLANVTSAGALDAVLVVVLAAFTAEFLLQLLGHWRTYFLRFDFWMDTIGILSVPLDCSFVTSLLVGTVDVDGATLALATKMVKLGVRAVRFSRLVKLLRFLPAREQSLVGSTAKRMADSLGRRVSIQVSCLIIVMVITLPTLEFFVHPQDDFSMAAWTALVDRAAAEHAGDLWAVLADFERFYSFLSYFPYEVQCVLPNGTSLAVRMRGGAPERTQDRVLVEAQASVLSGTRALFNFRAPHRTEAVCNCLLIAGIVLNMFVSASLVTHSVSRIVLVPLERLLACLQSIAGSMFSSVERMACSLGQKDGADSQGSEASEEGPGGFDEARLLERVLRKLSALGEITARRLPIEELEELGEAERALLRDFAGEVPGLRRRRWSAGPAEPAGRPEALRRLEEARLPQEALGSWELDVPGLGDRQRRALCGGLLALHAGEGAWDRCSAFAEAAAVAYAEPSAVPYHNWAHAADVAFTTFRCLSTAKAEHFLCPHEGFALVASAIGHDVGHPGRSNSFLIETAHVLAIRYNDASPLEHMHCCRLFEIASSPGAEIFSDLPSDVYREARQVCVDAILLTDGQCHFTLVNELRVTCGMHEDVFTAAGEGFEERPEEYPPREFVDFLRTPDARKLVRGFLLHFADISNSMKPWRFCCYWAELLFEEFFLQGDSEKAMGMVVQPLNDRERVNKPRVQLSFVEFFVAPLVSVAVQWLPPLGFCEEVLHSNLDHWLRAWVDTQPEPEEQKRVVGRLLKLVNG